MVTDAVPVEVNVTGCVEAVFTVTSPKVRLAALIVNCGLNAAVPVPLRLTTAVPSVDELLWMVSWPAAAPAAVGSNCTFRVTAWCGFNVSGNVAPDTVYPAPLSVAELMVTAAVPVEVNVTGCVDGVFTVTSPNVRLAALMVNCGLGNCGLDAAVPVPLRLTTAVLSVDESLWIVNWPVIAPVAVGSNCTFRVTDSVGFKVTGNVAPDIVSPAPLSVAALIVTGAVPVEVNVTGCVDAVFTVTSPNVRPAALIVNCGLDAAVPVPLRLTAAVLSVDELLWILSWPVAAPAVVGSNCTFRVTAWFGFKVTGNVAPDTVYPAPLSVAELTVTGAVPVEVNVTGWVEAVFTVTSPNVRLAALIVNCGLDAAVPVPLRLTTAVLLVDESLWMVSWPIAAPAAVGSNCTFRVTAWCGFNVTGNVAPDTVYPASLSVAALTVTGAVPVEVNVTGCVDAVFTVTSPNVRLAVLIVNCGLDAAAPVPLRLTTAVLLVDELLWILSWPIAAPAVVGSNCTFRVTAWCGFNVTGNVAPDTVYPAPLSAAELMVTDAVPVEVNVTGCVDAVFNVTSPKVRLAALIVNCGLSAAVPVPLRLTTAVLSVDELLSMLSWPAVTPAAVGSNCTFRVTACLGFNVSGNVAPDTVYPAPLSAAELMVTGAVPVEVNVTGWVEAVFTVTSPKVRLAALTVNCGLNTTVPVPLRLTTAVLLVDELLWMVSWPVATPAAAGSNCTFRVTDSVGFNVTGNVAPDIVRPAPLSVAALIVTGAVPVEVNVTGCVDAVFTVTSPKVRLAALIVSCGLDAAVPVPLRLTAAVLSVDELLWMLSWPVAAPAVVGSNCTFRVTDSVGFKVTGNVAPDIVYPAPLSVAELMVTCAVPVEVSVTGWVEAVFTVTSPNVRLAVLIVNCGLDAAVPVPLRLTTAVLPVDELLWIVSWPVATPAAVGSNCTFRVTAWFGFNVTGNVAPETVYPAPPSVAELMVTGAVPVEVNVTGCVEAVFTVTSPNVRPAALIVNCGLDAAVPVPLRLTTAVLLVDELLWMVSWPVAAPAAVGSNRTFRVTAWFGFRVTGNVAPDTVNPAPLSVAELMVTGAVPVEVNVTGCVEAVFNVTSPNVRLAALIVNCGLDAAVPVPLRLTTAVLLVDELLWILSWPVAAPAAVGSNCTFRVTAWFGFRVTGNVAPDTAYPAPLRAAELMVTGAVPVEVNVTGWADAVFTVTSPKVRLAALIVSCGLDNCGLNAAVPVPLRLTTAVPSVDELLWMVSWPVAAPAAVGSNCTFRVTAWFGFRVIGNVGPDTVYPAPLSVAELMVTGAVPVEVNVTGWVEAVFTVTSPNVRLAALIVNCGLDDCGLDAAVPVPLRLTTDVLLVDELLWMVSWSVAAPAVVGSNCTFRVTACVGFSVIGNVAPDTVYPAPLSVAELMVTGAVPVEVNVTGWVEAVFNVTSPNVRLAALTVSPGVGLLPLLAIPDPLIEPCPTELPVALINVNWPE
jgi:hypothetical protein